MAEQTDSKLCPPPTNFYRMVSWQLSQAQEYGDINEKERMRRKKKKKQERKKSSIEVAKQQELLSDSEKDTSASEDDMEEGSEDEVYYSAPSSPIISSDSEPESPMSSDNLWKNRPSKRRKQKKKRRKANRQVMVEFFQPLCKLIEDKLCLDVEDKKLTSQTTVPSLAEICLRRLQRISLAELDEELPYLLTTLLRQDRETRKTVTNHVCWLEKLLGSYELYLAKPKEESNTPSSRAYIVQRIWDPTDHAVSEGDFTPGGGYHAPLPAPNLIRDRAFYFAYDVILEQALSLYRIILHYVNYMYPRLVSEPAHSEQKTKKQNKPSSSLSSSITQVKRVNNWLFTRYPCLMKMLKDFIHLWPAYVHWARGNLKLATENFAAAVKLLENPCDQAIALSEMARMFVHYGERRNAVEFYCKSSNIMIPSGTLGCNYHPKIAPVCSLALQASVWDTGILDQMSAIQSACSWDVVLKMAKDPYSVPASVWFLHVAAAEAILFNHAGHPVDSSWTKKPGEQVKQWLLDCECMLMREKTAFPVLNYHLSLVHAMRGNDLQSHRTFETYINDFAGAREWNDGVLPGYQFTNWFVPMHQRQSPWHQLTKLLEAGNLAHAPIIPLKWRVQLLHPLHPYDKDPITHSQLSYIADHAPCTNLGLRLTADTQYLTGDIHMDAPPMRCVLIDPYTGGLCFSRATSFQHYTYSNGSETANDSSSESSLPWPLRLFESSWCTVELLAAHKLDMDNRGITESNYYTMLHWYDSDGSKHSLDLRKLIRNKMKIAMLEEAKRIYPNMDKAEKYIERMMQMGLELNIQGLSKDKRPVKWHPKSSPNMRRRIKSSNDFILELSTHLVIGKATIFLSFHLREIIQASRTAFPEVIVFINCKDAESFQNPQIYCCPASFSFLYPDSNTALKYPLCHMRHIKYVIAAEKVNENPKSSYFQFVVYDECGNVVSCLKIAERRRNRLVSLLPGEYVLGGRVIKLDETTHKVTSRQVVQCKEHHCYHRLTSAVVSGSNTLLVVPGLILVICNGGLCLLHPGTLDRVLVEGMKESDNTTNPQDGLLYPQFSVMEPKVAILKVLKVNCVEEGDRQEEEATVNQTEQSLEQSTQQEMEEDLDEDVAEEVNESHLLDCGADFGSCKVALAINSHLLVLHCPARTEKVSVVLDIDLPGRPSDIHAMQKDGYLVSCSQFPDSFREDLYWLSSEGQLLGMLPFLKGCSHSFFSTVLPPRSVPARTTLADATQSEREPAGDEENGGLHVYFDDGHGGICCLKPHDVIQ